MNARDISQKSFIPIMSEIFASQKQFFSSSKTDNTITITTLHSIPFPEKQTCVRVSPRDGKDRQKEIQMLNEHKLGCKSNVYL